MPPRLQITVVGAAACNDAIAKLAFEVGRGVAQVGASLLCGGRGGVMAAAAEGARAGGGLTIGLLPGVDSRTSAPNDHLDVVLFTGLGQARNQILVLSADVVIAIGGGWGTLSEISLALKYRVPVVLLESWHLARPDGLADPMMSRVATPHDAVEVALQVAKRRPAE